MNRLQWAAASIACTLVLVSCGGGAENTVTTLAGAPDLQDPFARAASAQIDQAGDLPPALVRKASQRVLTEFKEDRPQNVFVVLEDQDVQAEVVALRIRRGLGPSDQEILDHKFRRMADKKARLLSKASSSDVTTIKQFSHLPMVFARVRTRGALHQLLADTEVVGIYEDGIVYRAMLSQSLPLVGQPQAANAGNEGAGTAVAVLDQRVNYSLPAFGFCTLPGTPAGCKVLVAQDVSGLPNDGLGFQDGHGTNVAATVLAVAPGTNILSLNVFNGESTNVSHVIEAINWCIANAATYKIVAINMSLGGQYSTVPLTTGAYYTAFANARAAGILPVAAAGNDAYTNALSIPGAVSGAVSVGAVYDSSYGYKAWAPKCVDGMTAADQVACFSNSAPFLTLLAPGCQDDAGFDSGRYFCGTSQAAPHVAGAVAVLRARFPSESLTQTVSRLTNGVQVTDQKNGITKPRLNLPTALNLEQCLTTASPTTISAPSSGSVSGTIFVVTTPGCPWSATSNASWITILSGEDGLGNGTIRYFVAPNYGRYVRSASLSVAGRSVSVSQIGGAASPSSQSGVSLVGNASYQTYGLSSVSIRASEIFNASFYRTTGTLRLELWLAPTPYIAGGRGWRVTTSQITGSSNGTLGPYQSFLNLVSPYEPLVNLPAPGKYYAYLLLTEYYGPPNSCATDYFCLDSFVDFNGNFYVPDLAPPSVPTGVVASIRSPSQVGLTWNPSTDDVGVIAYKVYSGGTLLGRVSSNGALIYNLQPGGPFRFAVSACDAAENCSSTSTSVAGTMPNAVQPADCVFNWAERTYPQYFSAPGAVSRTSLPYYYRYYSNTQTYLAVSSTDNDIYVSGPVSGRSLLNVGPMASFLATAGCSS